MEMDRLTVAEVLCDIIREKENVLSETEIFALSEARYHVMCCQSPIQIYKCSAPIHFSSQSQERDFYCDTCLQNEIYTLVKKHNIKTIGSCCGHGTFEPYIQVSELSVPKMLELGYQMKEVDKFGQGVNCFVPKTKLYIHDNLEGVQ